MGPAEAFTKNEDDPPRTVTSEDHAGNETMALGAVAAVKAAA